VIINLSDQRASLVQQGRNHAGFLPLLQVNLVGQRRGVTSAFSTRISIIGLGASGLSLTLTEEWSTQMRLPAAMYPGAAIIDPRRGRTSWNSARPVGMHAGLPSRISRVPRMRCGMPRDLAALFFRASPNWDASQGGRQHAQTWLASEGPWPLLPTGSYVLGQR